MKELRLIERKVQDDIEKYFENEKLQLINQVKKSKFITKQNSFITAFKNNQSSLFANQPDT